MLYKLLVVTNYPHYARMIWWNTVVKIRLERLGVQLGEDVQLIGIPVVSMADDSEICLGARCSLCSDSRYTALGVNHSVVLRTLRPGSRIRIGSDTGISGATICAAAEVEIGNQVLIGANATIVDTDFHSLSADRRRYNNAPDAIAARPVHIADNVFIGAGAFILKGVTIGKNSVVGAGSVVVHDIPDNAIAAGNPAKVLGTVK